MILRVVFTLLFSFLSLHANELVLSGNIVSSNEKTISSRSMGFVKKVYVQEGQNVDKNQLLFELDDAQLQRAKKELELTHTMQQNEFENLTLNLQRQQRLLEQDLVPKYDVEQLQLRHKNLQQTLKITQAKLQEIQNEYTYLQLKAPNDGLVVKKSIREGEILMPGVPALVLTDLSALEIQVSLGESYINTIKQGQIVNVYVQSLHRHLQSTIETIVPSSTLMHHGFIIKIPLKNIEKRLYPGMYVQITIPLKSDNE